VLPGCFSGSEVVCVAETGFIAGSLCGILHCVATDLSPARHYTCRLEGGATKDDKARLISPSQSVLGSQSDKSRNDHEPHPTFSERV
ncbi:MAG TPA: hypothetical protein VEL77_02845, partial [Rugosimonospora sp.]|nr:hypothetical protein [Rugosimonospora sp.]